MWKHFIFFVSILLLSFKTLNAGGLVLKSDSFHPVAYLSSAGLHELHHADLDPIYPSLQAVAEMDVELNQDWLTDRWIVMIDLMWHDLLASGLFNDYRYEHVVDLEPIPIPRFLLFEQLKIPF
ncbi:hypothetical protein K7A41_22640 [Sphingobacterium sp. InxBP1]|uniref:hypothetical protein n=1 Tax=Sphingobacterium sp. InxBP1 TaxID=2870328 RepID=UPI002244CD75|nr:hypothetical protein [Sphingobacterium sp. InxBP1]MCW8314044.1 hypothetical protein [Sphingobacterium sp. InxBP1]